MIRVCAAMGCRHKFKVKFRFRNGEWQEQRFCSLKCHWTVRTADPENCRRAQRIHVENGRKRLAAKFAEKFGPLSAREIEILREARRVFGLRSYAKGYQRGAWLRGKVA